MVNPDPRDVSRDPAASGKRAMQVTLAGKVVLITGAARGIGAAIAETAARAGADALALTDRDPPRVAVDCPSEWIAADLTDPDAPEAICRAALRRFGRIDALVNAAGVTTRAGLGDATPALWDQMFAVNARAPFFLMAQAVADMRLRDAPGCIVNILSMNAHCGTPDLAVYSGTKAALSTLTKNAAHAQMAAHIRVNGINLGWVATETEQHLHEVAMGKGAGWLAAQASAQPLGRLVSAGEAARLAVYLLSDSSAPMTGVTLDLEQRVTGAPC